MRYSNRRDWLFDALMKTYLKGRQRDEVFRYCRRKRRHLAAVTVIPLNLRRFLGAICWSADDACHCQALRQ